MAVAFVPGLPTAVFVLSGSCFLKRGSPALEHRPRACRRLSAYLRYVDPNVPMPRREKVFAVVGMWTAIGLSTIALGLGHVNELVTKAVLLTGVIGTVAIVLFRRDTPLDDPGGIGFEPRTSPGDSG